MSDSEDDLKLNADLKIMIIDPKVKNPAKRSDHEKAALLSSGDEEDGDEDDDEEGITNYTGTNSIFLNMDPRMDYQVYHN